MQSTTHTQKVNECTCGRVGVDSSEQRRSMRAVASSVACRVDDLANLRLASSSEGSKIKSLWITKCDERKADSGRTTGGG